MKKLMFSAIALVAFSFAGMANEKKSDAERNDPCVIFSIRVVDALEELHGCEYSDIEAGWIMLEAYDLCAN